MEKKKIEITTSLSVTPYFLRVLELSVKHSTKIEWTRAH